MIKTIVSTALPVGERLLIKKNSIAPPDASQAGRRFCIVTGTHGDELEGQFVCYEMARLLSEKSHLLQGTVEIYPALNPLGIDSVMRGIPNFDLDMNRIFPGDAEASFAEHAAHTIIEDLKGAEMVIDIHSSNVFLREVPQARINVTTAECLLPLARHLHLDFIWVHEAATVLEATLAHSLNSIGTPTLVVEMGVGMRINHGYCRRLVNGIFNLMFHMGFWKERPEGLEPVEPVLSQGDEVDFVNADASGVFITDTHNNTIVEKGQKIGMIISSLEGIVLQHVEAPSRGLLFTIRAYPVVYQGSLLARIHRM